MVNPFGKRGHWGGSRKLKEFIKQTKPRAHLSGKEFFFVFFINNFLPNLNLILNDVNRRTQKQSLHCLVCIYI